MLNDFYDKNKVDDNVTKPPPLITVHLSKHSGIGLKIDGEDIPFYEYLCSTDFDSYEEFNNFMNNENKF